MDYIEEEKILIQQLLLNNTVVTTKLYKANYPMIQSLVVNNNGTIDEAKDIFQEAVIVLYENAQKSDFSLHCKISTYLYSVARRLWLKKLQQNSKRISLDSTEESTIAVEEDLEAHDNISNQLSLMQDALLKIGEPCKSLLEAYYFNKQQMSDIAKDFGYTNADNAKNQKYKCLMRLKKLFFAQYKNV